jgi:hypothetical protein
MKRFIVTLIICLVAAMPLIALAQDNTETKTNKLIEVKGEEGKILVFPNPISGPNGPIIKFVMFGISASPEVVIVTKDAAFSTAVTTIDFKQGEKFFGWFEVPQEDIIELRINGQFIPWENNKS